MSANNTEQSNSARQRVAAAIEVYLNNGQLELPVMPRVAQKVISLTNDPNADISDLSKLVHDDQAIASHVLRIANSATYGGTDSIVSLKQAVARLGMDLLGDIAVAVSMKSGIFKAPGFEAEVQRFLRHALAAGAYGKEIARKRRRNVEGQFLCGLMHSIGKPVTLDLISQTMKFVGVALEKEDISVIINALSPQVAAKVVKEWQLPRQIQVTTLCYNKYEDAPGFKDESAATYLSQLLASWLMYPARYDATNLAEDPAFEYLNFYLDDAEDLLAKKDEVKAIVSAMAL